MSSALAAAQAGHGMDPSDPAPSHHPQAGAQVWVPSWGRDGDLQAKPSCGQRGSLGIRKPLSESESGSMGGATGRESNVRWMGDIR